MVDGEITEGWVVGGGMVCSKIEESGRIDWSGGNRKSRWSVGVRRWYLLGMHQLRGI